ncbi:MAG TPA: PAS domain-containing protein, partial [Verrucomicrobiae bacterium]|nr:PAS domain-containing protein [Verrucomicrobiae bacterium]
VDVPSILKRLLVNESNLLQEVSITKSVCSTMQALSSCEAFSNGGPKGLAARNLRKTAVQVYLVTKNGLNRIFKSNEEKPEQFYARQFFPRTYFPARPYYQNALSNKRLPKTLADLETLQPTEKLGDHFEISAPYLDLAGNGVVITLSRALYLPNGVEMVLCIDLNFIGTLESKLTAKLKQFGAMVAAIDVTISGDVTSSTRMPIEAVTMFEDLRQMLRSEDQARASALGNIVVLNQTIAKTGGPIEVSLPLTETTLGVASGSVNTRFLLFRLDLGQYRLITIWFGVIAAGCFAAMGIFLASMLATTLQKNKDFAVALKRVADVMHEAPIAYLRLDFADHIVDCNPAASALLGISDLNESQRGKLTLRSFCLDPVSSSMYERVQSSRRAGEHVEPYVLALTSKGKFTRPVFVRIVSASIPGASRGNLPISFGILLPIDRNGGDEPLPREGA